MRCAPACVECLPFLGLGMSSLSLGETLDVSSSSPMLLRYAASSFSICVIGALWGADDEPDLLLDDFPALLLPSAEDEGEFMAIGCDCALPPLEEPTSGCHCPSLPPAEPPEDDDPDFPEDAQPPYFSGCHKPSSPPVELPEDAEDPEFPDEEDDPELPEEDHDP